MKNVSIYKGYSNRNPQDISLSEIVNIIRTDETVKSNTLKHRFFLENGMKADADREKDKANTFTLAVRCEGGKKLKDVVEFTGLAFGDFDKLPPDRVQEAFELLKKDPHTVLVFITHSGKGLRICYAYEMPEGYEDLDIKEKALFYKRVFNIGTLHYEKLLNTQSDRKCNDCTRVSNIVHDPNVYYNPEAVPFVLTLEEYRKGERKPVKVRRVSLGPAVRAAKAELEAQGYVFEPGHHNDYVCRMGYLLNLFGVDQDEATDWAIGEFSEEYNDDIMAIMDSCYAKVEEHGTRRLPKQGQVDNEWAGIEMIESFLASQAVFRYNVVRKQVEISWNTKPGVFRPLTDRDENTLWCRMKKKQHKIYLSDMRNVIHSEFSPEYNPFIAYFESLPPWDGVTDYIGQLANTIHVRGNQEEFVNFFRKWFVSIVPTLFDEQTVNHEILVLIGPQGTYKSTFFSKLLPPELQEYFYAKTNNGVLNKDDIITMSEYALICMDEIDGLRQTHLDQLKAMVTAPHTNERAAYQRNKERREHVASFCGTGNNPQFLIDRTGNRRWVAAEVISILNPHLHPFNYVGIYSQAYALWKSGTYKYWLDDDEIVALSERNKDFEVVSLEEELIQKYYRPTFPGSKGIFVTAADILEKINGSLRQPLSATKLGLAMRRLNFESFRHKGVRGYLVIERSWDEIKASQRRDADELSSSDELI